MLWLLSFVCIICLTHLHHLWVMQVYQSLSQCSFSLYSITEVCRVVLLLFCCDMFLLKSFYSQSALSSSCSLQLLSSRSSWPWWPSVTLQSPSARMEISPTRLHLQVDHTSIDTASGYTVQCAALLSPQCTMRVCVHIMIWESCYCPGTVLFPGTEKRNIKSWTTSGWPTVHPYESSAID